VLCSFCDFVHENVDNKHKHKKRIVGKDGERSRVRTLVDVVHAVAEAVEAEGRKHIQVQEGKLVHDRFKLWWPCQRIVESDVAND
jgi:hypothetical protein